MEDEAFGIFNHVDNETRGARLVLVKGINNKRNGTCSEQNHHVENKSGKADTTSAKDNHLVDPNKQLERIWIPKFLGDKMKYPILWAAFWSFLDKRKD